MPDSTEDHTPGEEAPDPGVTRHFGESGADAAPDADDAPDPGSTNIISSEALQESKRAREDGEAVDTGDLDAEELVLDPDTGEPAASTKMFAVGESGGEAEAPADTARDDPTTIIGSDEIQLDEPSLGAKPSDEADEDALDPTTVHGRDEVDAAAAGEERTTVHEREEVEVDLGSTVVADDAPKPKPPKAPLLPAKPDYVPLAGEADEIAPEQPHSLRPSGAMQVAMAEGMTTSDFTGPSKLLWIAAGALMGIGAFALFFFSSSGDASEAFEFPATLGEPETLAAPEGIQVSRWERWGSYYWGLEPAEGEASARVHLYDPDPSAESAYRGAAVAVVDSADPSAPALIGAPRFDGYIAAWLDGGTVVWNPISGAAAPADEAISGWISLGEGIRPVYAPVRVEQWNRSQTERFVVVGRAGVASDRLIAVNPGTRVTESLDLGAGGAAVHALAPPVSLYLPGPGRALLLVATSLGPMLIDATGEALERVPGRAGGPRYAESLDSTDWSTIRRIRLGSDGAGWIIAHSDGYAVVGAVTDDAGDLTGLRIVNQGAFGGSLDRPRAGPWVVTFPNSDQPDLDDAVILLGPEMDNDGNPLDTSGATTGFWISTPGLSTAQADEFFGPGSQPAAADFNGDGFWDLAWIWDSAGIEDTGRLWIVDGSVKPVGDVENVDAVRGLSPASPISWRRRAEGMEAFYFTEGGVPARWLLPVRSFGDGGIDDRLAADWDWRIGLGALTGPR